MSRADNLAHAVELISRAAALLGAESIDVHAHGCPIDTLAAVLMAPEGAVHKLADGTHVATMRSGRVGVDAYGKAQKRANAKTSEAREETP